MKFNLKPVKKFIEKRGSLLLAIGAVSSVGLSVVTTVKATLAVEDIVESDIPKKKKRTAIVKKITPPAISTAVAITCIIFLYTHNKKKEAALVGALVSANELIRKSQSKLTDEQKNQVFDEYYGEKFRSIDIPDGKKPDEIVVVEPISGQVFFTTKEKLIFNESEFNNLFTLKEIVSFNEWLDILELDYHRPDGEMFGWSKEAEFWYGYKFIEFEHRKYYKRETGEEYYVINYVFPPHYDYESPGEELGSEEGQFNIPEYVINEGDNIDEIC